MEQPVDFGGFGGEAKMGQEGCHATWNKEGLGNLYVRAVVEILSRGNSDHYLD